jgi:aminocarboxymuconate-semialdehyde decarboxylase
MQNPQMAATELRRCVQDLGLAGVQIGSHVNDWNLDDPSLFPVYEVRMTSTPSAHIKTISQFLRISYVLKEAERLGACIFVHPWDMMGKEKMPKYWLPW